ncbi:MAG: NAD(P)-dependent glycerol-3-phosphate dehydrogenase [Ruminococcaceae bacterium]|nr:NAD(P)-dependent glycerol-3-phosphate dehydrogenase [Oscillospiraceae bacterium]
MKISVFGSGGWGTALAVLLAKNDHDVTLWSYRKDQITELERDRENRKHLPGVEFPDNLKLSPEIAFARDADLLVMAVPSFAVRDTAKQVRPYLKQGTIVVSVSKGIDRESGKCYTSVLRDSLGDGYPIVALSGPSHAEEVGREIPTAIISASEDQTAAETVQRVFMNANFRVYTSSDVVGVELGGALKNIIALTAGINDGLGLGDNSKAALMTRGLAEMARLCIVLGGKRETLAGLAGVGDLIVTCTSQHSRNRRAGILIGQGVSPEDSLKQIGAVVEGYYATYAGKQLADQVKVEMPITEQCYQVLYCGKDPMQAMAELMARPGKSEIEVDWL